MAYVAHYDLDSSAFSTLAVLQPDVAAGGPVPAAWLGILSDHACDLALRLTFRGGTFESLLLLVGPLPSDDLLALADRLRNENVAREARFAENAVDFDGVTTAAEWTRQLRLNPRGFRAGPHPVAADFRLRPLLDSLARTAAAAAGASFAYQITLRRYAPSREVERAVRKHLAGLRLESPFPPPLTALQTVLATRLLSPGFLSDEFLLAKDDDFFAQIMSQVAQSFTSTMGGFGFFQPPVESGRFDELLSSGIHTSYIEPDEHLIHQGAGLLSLDETRRLLRLSPRPGRAPGSPGVGGSEGEPHVFISYSSRDFAAAQETCLRLEADGIRCWIAPRDIPSGESYPEAILRGINGCRALVVLLSQSSNLSPHVHREIERALHRNAVVIPLRLEAVEPSGSMEYLLATCQWLDGIGPGLSDALTLLVRRLGGLA